MHHLSRGTVGAAEGAGPSAAWERATPLQRATSRRLLETWLAWGSQVAAIKEDEDAALRRVMAGRASPYSGDGATVALGKDSKGREMLPKGAMCSVDVEELALPPPGTIPAKLADICPLAAEYFSDVAGGMLREPSKAMDEELKGQMVYRDPSLRSRASRLRLAERLWDAGMLGTTDELVEGVSLFGVIKKYLQEEGGPLSPARRQVRAIWDQRWANLRWQRPPYVPLGSPATFAHVDLSSLGERDVVYTGVGDIPDMFYRLETPPDVWPYFVLEEVPVHEFVEYMRTKGRGCVIPDGGPFLALKVLVLGWSWAPFLAHSTPQACVARGLGEDSVGARLVYGAPTPQLTGPEGFESVNWAYMDDYGVMATSASVQQPVSEVVSGLTARVKHYLRQVGPPVHKETEGEGLESLGAVIRGRPYSVSAETDRTCGLALVTLRLVERTYWTAELLERVVGLWAWAAIFQRTGLAIFDQVYHEMRRPETAKTPFRLTDAARWELTTMAYCAPLLRTDLEAPWLSQVFMTDSSDTGYGVAVTDASLEEIRKDARYSEMRGWTIATEDIYTAQEEDAWVPHAGGCAYDVDELIEASTAPPPRVSRRVYRLLCLFAGRRREGDLEEAIHSRAERDGYEVEVWSIDAVINPKHDLTNDEFVSLILSLARDGYFHAPWGRSDMSFTAFERLRLDLGSRLLLSAMQAVREVCRAGGLGLMEHPADPEEDPYPSIWNLPEMACLLEETGGRINRIDQCRYGAPSMKPTMIGIFGFYDDALDLAADRLRLRCNHRGRHQAVLKGRAYQPPLCAALAKVIIEAFARVTKEMRGPDPTGSRVSPSTSSFGPPRPGRARIEKRGPRAWDNYEKEPHLGISEGGFTRLLTHSVADVSAAQWAPKVRDFLSHCVDKGWELRSANAVDHALADYMDMKCYKDRLRPAWGSIVLFGLLVIWPELRNQLPLALRSLKSWQRLVISVEGGPLPEEAVFAIAIYFFEAGLLDEAIWTLVQCDVYGRGQDMEMLREADIIWDGRCVGLLFGISARGEEGKTGSNQEVVIRRGTVASLILALKGVKKNATGPIFGPKQAGFRKEWHRACRSLGMPWAPPPHGLRHSGPSEDVARGRASLEQVRRRGRWKALFSVQRCSKTFALAQFRATMPQKVLAGHLAAEMLRAIESRTNYSKQEQLVDGIRANMKTKKVKDVAAELLMLGPTTKQNQKTTTNKKSTKGDTSCPESDDLYSDETSSSRVHHLVDVEVEQYWLDDDLAQLWAENQLIGWPPAVHPVLEPPGSEPEVWSTVNVRMRRGVVGPHARETIHGDRPHPGEILANKYRVSRTVGEGHFTKAYLAEDITTGTSVCLKRHRNLSVEALADLMVIGRRLDEVDLGGGLFPKLLDAFYDLVGYTVEGLVEGKNCLVVLQRDRTFFQSMDNLRVVAHGGLRGLMYLDRAGVVHNDVKPDNIIWTQAPMHHGVPVESPTVQIVDFGCARLDQREEAGRNWSLAEGGAGHLGKWSPE
ncbi:unnamed protein product, partial [Prorocentrum cordatum]